MRTVQMNVSSNNSYNLARSACFQQTITISLEIPFVFSRSLVNWHQLHYNLKKKKKGQLKFSQL